MTTEDIIELFIQSGIKAYKKLNGKTEIGKQLYKQKPTEIDGVTFSSWREYTVYKMAEYIKDVIPNSEVTAILDGPDSNLSIEGTDEDIRKLTGILYSKLKQEGYV